MTNNTLKTVYNQNHNAEWIARVDDVILLAFGSSQKVVVFSSMEVPLDGEAYILVDNTYLGFGRYSFSKLLDRDIHWERPPYHYIELAKRKIKEDLYV